MTGGTDFTAQLLQEIAASAKREHHLAAVEAERERRRAEDEAASNLSHLRSKLLTGLTDAQQDGREPLHPDVAEAYQLLFPDGRPIINGRLATGAQMMRLEEAQERRELIEWLVSKGRTLEQARASVNAEYGDPLPAQTPRPVTPVPEQRPAAAAAAVEDASLSLTASDHDRIAASLQKAFGLTPAAAEAAARGRAGQPPQLTPDEQRLAALYAQGAEMRPPRSEVVRLRESAATLEPTQVTAAGGKPVPVVLISPGWGSSGYYSPAVLEQAARDRVIPAGTQMYADHPTKSDRIERPERSVHDLVGVLTEDAQWNGTALVSKAQFFPPYDDQFRAMRGAIGLSILGDATDISHGTAEGRSGRIIGGLAHVHSVDVVTRAGRGGAILPDA